jgi:hypothetical protein
MEPLANARVVGVGRRKTSVDDRQRTPARKICHQFREYKHTLFIFLAGESSEVSSTRPRKTTLVTFVVTFGRR